MAGNFGKQVGKLSIKVLPNATQFYNGVRDMVKEAEERYQVNLDVLAETKRAREQLDKLYQEWDGRDVALQVQVTTAKAKAELLALTRPRQVTVVANIKQKAFAAATGFLDRISGTRVARNVFSEINDQILDLDKNVGKISRVSLSFASLTSTLLSTSAGMLAIGGDFLKVINLALVAPAAIGGLAVGMTTLVVALKDASTQLASIGPAFTKLGTSIKGNFWAEARQPIIDFVTKYLPQLDAGFSATATAIGKQGAAIVTALSSSMGNGVMEGLFKNLVATIDAVTKGMAPMVDAFVRLGVIGSAYLPNFGKWLADLATQFDGWVQKGQQTGQITSLIQSGIQAAQDFGRAVGGAAGILKGFYDASKAAGAGGLTGFADALNGASTIINGPAFQTALTTLFKGAGYATDSIGVGFQGIAKMIADNAPAISGALGSAGATVGRLMGSIAKALDQPAVRQGLTDLFSGIDVGVKGLEPALKPLGELFGTLMTAVGALAAAFGPLLGTIKTTLAPVFDALLQAIIPLIPIIGDALTSAITTLEPLFQGLADFINGNQAAVGGFILGAAGLVTAIGGIVKVVGLAQKAWGLYKDVMGGIDTARIVAMYAGDFVKNIASSTAAIAKQTAAWVTNTAKAAAAKAASGAQWIASQAAAIATTTANLAKQAAAWVATAAKAVAYKVAQAAISVATKAAAAAQWLLNAAMDANPIGLIVIAIAALVAGLIWFFTQTKLGQQIWAGFVSFLTQAWANIVSVATTVFTNLGTFFSDLWNSITSTVTTVWNNILTFFTTLWSNLTSFFATWGPVILAIIAPFIGIPLLIISNWDSIVAFLSGVWANIMSVATTVFTNLGSFFTDVWNNITDVATTVWNAVVSFLSGVWGNITSFANSVFTSLASFFSGVWSGISNVVSTVWNSIVGFVTNGITKAQSIVVSIGNAIRNTWSGLWNGIVGIVSSAWSGISGFVGNIVSGISGMIGNIGTSLAGIKDKVVSAISGAGKWLLDAGKSIVQGLIDGITGMIGKAKSAASDLMAGIKNLFPHSPAPEGPFSGKGWVLYSGYSIGEAFADGITARTKSVRNAALGMMSAAAGVGFDTSDDGLGLSLSSTGGYGGGGDTITVEGNVGYDPQQIADQILLKKRQAALVAGMGKVPVR